jgi:hypothetical protein
MDVLYYQKLDQGGEMYDMNGMYDTVPASKGLLAFVWLHHHTKNNSHQPAYEAAFLFIMT